MRLQVLWFVIKYIALRVTWFVVLNAIFFHFYHLHPYPSPRPGKCCYLEKTPENSTFALYRLILPVFVGFPTKFFGLCSRAGKFFNCIDRLVQWYIYYALYSMQFLVYTPLIYFNKRYLYLLVNTIYFHYPYYNI